MFNIDLSDRTALVIGGSRGIGAGITEALSSAGAYTVFTHTGNPQNKERIRLLVEKVQANGGNIRDAAVDALDSQGMKRLIEKIVVESGSLDILIANVGKNFVRTPSEMDDDDWHSSIDINLTSSFYGIRPTLEPMVKKGYGKIILIGSSAVFDGGGGGIDYAAGKAALSGIMAYLSRTYLKKGIRTNIIHPCVIETDLLKARYDNEDKRQRLIDQIPVGRLGQPEDIAGLAVLLSSSWGDYICGQEILIDGGRTLFNR